MKSYDGLDRLVDSAEPARAEIRQPSVDDGYGILLDTCRRLIHEKDEMERRFVMERAWADEQMRDAIRQERSMEAWRKRCVASWCLLAVFGAAIWTLFIALVRV
jgi:hypothetical protein